MDPSQSELQREAEFFSRQIDPIAREVLEAMDPWAAYRAGNRVSDALVGDLPWLPHGGEVYRGWAELTDLFETGKTSIPDAQAALRKAAVDWLAMSSTREAFTIEWWIGDAATVVSELIDRDGGFWRSPA